MGSSLQRAANRWMSELIMNLPFEIKTPGLVLGVLLLALSYAAFADADATSRATSPYARWTRGPSHDPSFFPIAVWLQSPSQAGRYRAAGFNTYVGLWKGPTEDQLRALEKAGMRVICDQNAVALQHLDSPAIIGWMHGDEPDNAQALPGGGGYGPPIPAERIVESYRKIRTADPSRPVLLNLGQGVAWDRWHGRGVRTNHPEDYPEYVQGCDIASFDIYPVAHNSPEVAGNLWFVAQGVERLRRWAGPDRIVWNCLECTRINTPDRKATPDQVRAEAWMSIVHGSMGLIYFVHEWKPRFREVALLDDPEMLTAVTALNRQIAQLADVLNTPTLEPGGTVTSESAEVPVAALWKRARGAQYVFAVALRGAPTTAEFRLPGTAPATEVEVIDEGRTLPLRDGRFRDSFGPWQVHLYRVFGSP